MNQPAHHGIPFPASNMHIYLDNQHISSSLNRFLHEAYMLHIYWQYLEQKFSWSPQTRRMIAWPIFHHTLQQHTQLKHGRAIDKIHLQLATNRTRGPSPQSTWGSLVHALLYSPRKECTHFALSTSAAKKSIFNRHAAQFLSYKQYGTTVVHTTVTGDHPVATQPRHPSSTSAESFDLPPITTPSSYWLAKIHEGTHCYIEH
jgi:hypothetical protein